MARISAKGDLCPGHGVTFDKGKLVVKQVSAVHGDGIYDKELAYVVAQGGVIGIAHDSVPAFRYVFLAGAPGEGDKELGLHADKVSGYTLRQP